MYKYEIIINWSEQDQVFIAKVPELLGCIAHEKTHEEAIFNIQDALPKAQLRCKHYGLIQLKSLETLFHNQKVYN